MAETSLKLLIVDDHADTAMMMHRSLTYRGYTVTTALSAEDALGLAKLQRFDVLLTDIGMPEHDGYELLGKVRALYRVRAIAVTAFAYPEDLKRVAEAGFDDVLLKPIELDQLHRSVEAIAAQVQLDRNTDQPALDRKSPFDVPEPDALTD